MNLGMLAIPMLILGVPAAAQMAAGDGASQQAPRIAGMFDPAPADKGQIIFWRPGGLGPGCTVREGQASSEIRLSKLTSNRYFVHLAEPGIHHYWAKNLAKDDINLEIEPGETYFVKCEIAIGMMASTPNLSPSNASEFESYKDKGKLRPMDIPAP
ncbi:hypothetical protein U1769_00335 [Sphingomonas sp. ZT3P38]|uniref:hypothetical protein n=1 Tax=Parasphingomonas zepuensis TaxID=3096161 RepID=UPI002FC8EABB